MTKIFKKATCTGIGILILVLYLTACKSSDEQLQIAIAATQFSATKTQEAIITPTPTKPPIEEIDFSKLIFQDGDLPGDLTPSQVRSQPDNTWASTLVSKSYPILVFIQDVKNKDAIQAGVVTITLFNTKEEAATAYDHTVSTFPIESLEDSKAENIGDKSISMENYFGGFFDSTYLMFVKCQSVVVVAFSLADDKFRNSYDAVVDYSKRLDSRIDEVVCR